MFKDNTSFRSCISKINNTLIDNTQDFHIAMSVHNLLEYSDKYSMISASLCNYYRDDTDVVHDNASEGKSFKYKTKRIGNTPKRPPLHGNIGDTG